MMLTMSFSMTPMLAVVSMGLGVPNITSENSVPIMEPPQPSDRPARRDWRISASGREEQPIWVMCRDWDTSRSMARGSMPASFHSSWVCSGARLRKRWTPKGLPYSMQADLGHFVGQVVDVLALGLHAPFLGDADQLLGILDLIVAALAGLVQGVA